jgi:hypothetical protein
LTWSNHRNAPALPVVSAPSIVQSEGVVAIRLELFDCKQRLPLAVGGSCGQQFLGAFWRAIVPSVRKVESMRERAFDSGSTDADVSPMNLHRGSSQPIEPVCFTNVVYSPPSEVSQSGNSRSTFVRGLLAALWQRLFSGRPAEKELTLLDYARPEKR